MAVLEGLHPGADDAPGAARVPELTDDQGLAELARDLDVIADPRAAARGGQAPVLRIEVDRPEVDHRERGVRREGDAPAAAVEQPALIAVGRDRAIPGTGRLEALFAAPHQVVRVDGLDMGAHLGEPLIHPRARAITGARLVGQLPPEHRRVVLVRAPVVRVDAVQEVAHVVLVELLAGRAGVEGIGALAGRAPLHVLGHPAVVPPVVDEGDQEPDAGEVGLVQDVVHGLERALVVGPGARLEAAAVPVEESPRPEHREPVAGGEGQHAVGVSRGAVGRGVQHEVGVGAHEPEGAPVEDELPALRRYEAGVRRLRRTGPRHREESHGHHSQGSDHARAVRPAVRPVNHH